MICHNGAYRRATQEENEALQANLNTSTETPKTPEERIAELEEAIALLLEGAVE